MSNNRPEVEARLDEVRQRAVARLGAPADEAWVDAARNGKKRPRTKRSDLIPDEAKEQRLLAAYADSRPDLVWEHIPNERIAPVQHRAELARRGMKPGSLDNRFYTPPPLKPGRHGVAIELKRSDGGSVKPDQAKWVSRFFEVGWLAFVCEGHREAIEKIEECYGPHPRPDSWANRVEALR